jgi:hypothetical protein
MTWKNFTIYVHPDRIAIHFPQRPRVPDDGAAAFFKMLVKAGFDRHKETILVWERSRTDFWVSECYRLAAKFAKYKDKLLRLTSLKPEFSAALYPRWSTEQVAPSTRNN